MVFVVELEDAAEYPTMPPEYEYESDDDDDDDTDPLLLHPEIVVEPAT